MGKPPRLGGHGGRLRAWRLHCRRLLFLLGAMLLCSVCQHLRATRLSLGTTGLSPRAPGGLARRDLADGGEAGLANWEESLGPPTTQRAKASLEVEDPGMTAAVTQPAPRDTPSPELSTGTLAAFHWARSRRSLTPTRPWGRRDPSAAGRPRGGSRPLPAQGKARRTTSVPLLRLGGTETASALVTLAQSIGVAPRATAGDGETVTSSTMPGTLTFGASGAKPTPPVPGGSVTALEGGTQHLQGTWEESTSSATPPFLKNAMDTATLSLPDKMGRQTPRRMDPNHSPKPLHLTMTPQERLWVRTPQAASGRREVTDGHQGTQASTSSPASFGGLPGGPSPEPVPRESLGARSPQSTQHPRCLAVPSLLSPPSQSPAGSPEEVPPEPPALPPQGEYPPDLFSVEERRQGWLALHILGVGYVFVALAIVCDEYFVPALGVITEKLQISEDVAGATFMAAGGSAPELFTSLIGVFIAHSNVGIGTIVGSAVFNILFVIGTCSLFSREVLHLTWWPLFRDVSFYVLDLLLLIAAFLDSRVAWWESLLLLLAYAAYVLTMKWNRRLEAWVKAQLSRRPGTKVTALGDLAKLGGGATTAAEQSDNKRLKLPSLLMREGSSASLHNSTNRSPIFWLMVHSLDPLGEASREKEEEGKSQEPRAAAPARGARAESSREEEESARPPTVSVTPAPTAADQGAQENPHSQGREDTEPEDTDGAASQAPGGSGDVVSCRGEDAPTGDEQAEVEGTSCCGGTADAEEPQGCGAGEGQSDEAGDGDGQRAKDEGDDGGNDGGDDGAKDEGNDGVDDAGDDAGNDEAKDGGDDGAKDGGDDGGDDEGGGEEKEKEEEEEEEESDEDDDDDDEEEEEEEEGEEPLSLEWPDTWQKQAIFLFLLPIVFPLWLTVPDVRRQESRKFFVFTFLGSIVWIAAFSYLMVWWAHQVGETIGISEEIMGLTILAAGTSIPDLITSVIVARKGLGDMAVSSSVGSNIFDITVGLPVPWLLFSLVNGLRPVPVSSNGLFCAIVLLFLMLLFVISSVAACRWRMNKLLGLTMFLLYFVFLVVSVLLEDRVISCPVSV